MKSVLDFLTSSPFARSVSVALSFSVLACIGERMIGSGPDRTLPALARFTGTTRTDSLSGAFGAKWNQIRNPRITVVWQSLGFTPRLATYPGVEVKTSPPFDFNGTLLLPPPPEVLNADRVSLGSFWLYADVNGNGLLDPLVHPELALRQDTLEVLNKALLDARRTLLASSIPPPAEGTEVEETYRLSSSGTLSGPSDTSGALVADFSTLGIPPSQLQGWLELLADELKIPTKWNAFFSYRHRENKLRLRREEGGQNPLVIRIHYRRRLFPRPDKEREFQKALVAVVSARRKHGTYGDGLSKHPSLIPWMDFPYQANQGRDWVAGRSRWYQVLYFPTAASLSEVLEAEKFSSFDIAGWERLRPGYNLIHYNDQYQGTVLPFTSPIQVDLGPDFLYFDGPAAPPRPQAPVPGAGPLPPSALSRLPGRYELSPKLYIDIQGLPGGGLAADLTASALSLPGRYRLVDSGGGAFRSPVAPLAFQFLGEAEAPPRKLFVYLRGQKYSAVRIGDLPRESGLAGFSFPENPATLPVDTALLRAAAGLFRHGRDTVAITLQEKGEGLRVFWPGHDRGGMDFFPVGGGRFAHPWSDLALDFTASSEKGFSRLQYRLGEKTGIVFRAGHRFRTPAEIFGRDPLPDSLPSFGHEGSARDPFRTWDGKARFPCASDGLFLKAGDGIVTELKSPESGDSLSLHGPGSRLLLQVPAREGRWFGLKLKACPEAAAKTVHKLLAIAVTRAGIENPAAKPVYADTVPWVVGTEGSEWVLNPLPFEGASVDLEIRVLDHPEESGRRIALDGYQLRFE